MTIGCFNKAAGTASVSIFSAQKVKPPVQVARQLGNRLGEFRQLQNVKLHVLGQGKVMGRLQEPKPEVIIRHVAK